MVFLSLPDIDITQIRATAIISGRNMDPFITIFKPTSAGALICIIIPR